MSGYLLDSNVAIAILKSTLDLEQHRANAPEIFLCLPVLGELLFGAELSQRPRENRERIDRLLAVCPLVEPTLATAVAYGEIKADLRRKGRLIPENDLWISAYALAAELVVVTRDDHFHEVAGLQVERW
jgi:tRNA(fMet)-specific endonuclease VapC